MNSDYSIWRLPVAAVAMTIALTGCEQRIDDALELGAANAADAGASSTVVRPPVHNPDQAAFYNPDQPSPYENYNFSSSLPPSTSTSTPTTDTESSSGGTDNSDSSDPPDTPGNSPSDANGGSSSGGSSSGTDSSGRTGPAKFGQERFYGYWKIQSTETYSQSNHIFIIAQYDGEIWHDRYNNILTSNNCFELVDFEDPFQLELIQGNLGFKLEPTNSDAMNYREYSYDSNQDELVRETYRDGELADTTRYWRLWGGTTREEMLDCER